MSMSIEETKSVGGKIPEDLFWQFKAEYTGRRESATEALVHAIRLYIDAGQKNNSEEEVK